MHYFPAQQLTKALEFTDGFFLEGTDATQTGLIIERASEGGMLVGTVRAPCAHSETVN